MFFVYKLTHRSTGKSYIGRTDDIEKSTQSLFQVAKNGAIGQFWNILRTEGASSFDFKTLHATEAMRENDSMFYYYTNEYQDFLFMEAYKIAYPEKQDTKITPKEEPQEPQITIVGDVSAEAVAEAPKGRNGPVKIHLMKKPDGSMVRIAGLVKACEHYGISYQMILKNGKTKNWEMVQRNIPPTEHNEVPLENYV